MVSHLKVSHCVFNLYWTPLNGRGSDCALFLRRKIKRLKLFGCTAVCRIFPKTVQLQLKAQPEVGHEVQTQSKSMLKVAAEIHKWICKAVVSFKIRGKRITEQATSEEEKTTSTDA